MRCALGLTSMHLLQKHGSCGSGTRTHHMLNGPWPSCKGRPSTKQHPTCAFALRAAEKPHVRTHMPELTWSSQKF